MRNAKYLIVPALAVVGLLVLILIRTLRTEAPPPHDATDQARPLASDLSEGSSDETGESTASDKKPASYSPPSRKAGSRRDRHSKKGPAPLIDVPQRSGRDTSGDKIRAGGSSGKAFGASGAAGSGEEGAYKSLRGHRGRISAIAYSRDGRLLASGTFNTIVERSTAAGQKKQFATGGELKIWDLEELKELTTLRGHPEDVHAVAFHPNGRTLASSSKDRALVLWVVKTGKEITRIQGRRAPRYRSLAFSPDGSLLALGTSSERIGGTIGLWKPPVREGISFKPISSQPVIDVAFNADGSMLAFASADGSAGVLDVKKRKVVAELPSLSGGAGESALDANASIFAWVQNSIWIRSPGGQPRHQNLPRGASYLSASFAPDGRWLALGLGQGNQNLLLWDYRGGRVLQSFEGHKGGTSVVVASPDGKFLATSGGEGKEIRIWETNR